MNDADPLGMVFIDPSGCFQLPEVNNSTMPKWAIPPDPVDISGEIQRIVSNAIRSFGSSNSDWTVEWEDFDFRTRATRPLGKGPVGIIRLGPKIIRDYRMILP